MSRVSMFNSPLLLGFDQLERTLDRLAKSAEGYPPYNIERIGENGLRITLAVAGFASDDLAIELVESQLTVRGKQTDDGDRVFLHRGIAARQFQRAFMLAEGIEVTGPTGRDVATEVGQRSTLGAGTTLTKDAPAGKLIAECRRIGDG